MSRILLEAIGGIRDEFIVECIEMSPVCAKKAPVKRILLVAALVGLLTLLFTGVVAATYKQGPLYTWFQSLRDMTEDQTVVATVNGEPIYRSTIKITRSQANMSLENGRIAMETAGVTEEQKAAFLQELEKAAGRTDKEILDEKIREQVIYQEALQNGLEADLAEARKQASDSYYTLKKAVNSPHANESTITAWQTLQDFMHANGLTEEEYLEQSAFVYQQGLTKHNLFVDFCYTYQGNDPTAAYEAYVDDLVEAAEIVYH